MRSVILPFIGIAGLAINATNLSYANDNALYADTLPEDAVFIRWLDKESKPTVFEQTFKKDLADTGNFLPVSSSLLPLSKPGTFYSVSKNIVIEEPNREDPTKVYLLLLNTSKEVSRIVVEDNGAEVIGETEQNEANARAVNPVSATLTVFKNDTALESFKLDLRRGQNLTFLVSDGGVQLIENAFTEVTQPL